MIDLFTAATMNGRRAALALTQCGLAHRVHRLDLNKGDQRKPQLPAVNPRGTVPAIVDDNGPGGATITVTQSAAIVLYCAEKSGQLMPNDPQHRIEALDWFMHAVTDLGRRHRHRFNCRLLRSRAQQTSVLRAAFPQALH